MIYLASPYSDPDPVVRSTRFQTACRVAAHLMRHGHQIFSPIAHSHPIATYAIPSLPRGWDYWRQFDEEFLGTCDELWILTLPGWRESEGVCAEIALWRQWEADRDSPDEDVNIRYVNAEGTVTDEPEDA